MNWDNFKAIGEAVLTLTIIFGALAGFMTLNALQYAGVL